VQNASMQNAPKQNAPQQNAPTQNAATTAAAERPRPIETADDAKLAIGELTQVMDGLEAVVVEETQLVRAGQLSKASGLGLKKAELSGLYFKTVERLKAHGKLLARLVPQDIGQLARRHELLQGLLKTNLMVLATAHAVSEGIMRRLSGDLARKASPQVYGASGRTSAPDPRRAHPLALSRTL
jgi:hypothetical protein